MVRMSRQDLESIVEEQRPGYTIVDFDEDDDATFEDGPMMIQRDRVPDVTQYVADPMPDEDGTAVEAGSADEPEEAGTAASAAKPRNRKPKPRSPDEPEDSVIVVARKDTGADPWSHGPGPKTIVVSGTTGRITAEQG